ncbi:MAG: hypothetical protein ACQET5_10105 [Halobacteriota archaeon]|uniref:hypothetical protein n=1 Tax=Natronomonas sp. TaxID=2184060 RepID=UPI00397705C5
MSYERVADLDLRIDEFDLELRTRDTSSGFERITTVVSLHGDGETGNGEDVTYDGDANVVFARSDVSLPIPHDGTLDAFSDRLAQTDLFPAMEPEQPVFRNYRRWAFESAALDLALKQAEQNLGTRLDRTYDPVRFVVSTRLGEPQTGDRVLEWLGRNPDLEFKLDPVSAWTDETIERLAATDAVRILDLKGLYHGTNVDQPANPELYERVLDGFPDALIEDPNLTDETRPLFEGDEHRVTWDYPIRGIETIEELPWEPDWLNIKPSRFGSLGTLFDSIEYCLDHDIELFGGGQFELDVGREHLHAIASLFYPGSPNDVAPSGYNDPNPSDRLPSSPLEVPSDPRGLSWTDS